MRGSDSSRCAGEPCEGFRQGGTALSMLHAPSGDGEDWRSRGKSGSQGPVWMPLWCSRHKMRGEKWADWGGTLEVTRMAQHGTWTEHEGKGEIKDDS